MTDFGSKVGSDLHREHRSTLMALDALERLLANKQPVKIDSSTHDTIAQIARAMELDVTRHFGFEEAHLFPMLMNAGATFMVNMLLSEHAAIRPLALEIHTILDRALTAGAFPEADWLRFKDVGQELIDRETFHIQKEEMGLLSALAQLLDPQQDEMLSKIHGELP